VGRLKSRKTDSADDLSLRIATAQQELKRATEFDFVMSIQMAAWTKPWIPSSPLSGQSTIV